MIPIPYTDYLYIKPCERKQILVSDTGRLETYGEVLAIGDEVRNTKVGDFVAFELWDKAEFQVGEETYHFVKEKDAICKLDLPK